MMGNTNADHQQRGMLSLEPRLVALHHVLKDPEHNWKRAPEQLRQDKNFVITVVRQGAVLPPKSDFERAFPQSLRFDRDVVLAFCGRSDFEQIYHDRHLFVPECLTNDKKVMMAYCSRIPRQLQECSEELCDDREVVLTAVQRNGLELQYASHRLQQDEEILRTACSLDGRALEFCPLGPTRDRLLADKNFLTMVLRNRGASMLRLVQDSKLKQDRELLLCGVNHGLGLRYIPRQFQKDPDFVVAAVAQNANVYLELQSVQLQQNARIARAAVLSPTSDATVISKASQCAPIILNDAGVAEAVTDRADIDFMQTYLAKHPHFFQVKEVMLRAVERDHGLYQRASPGLQSDVDIVLNAIGKNSASAVLCSVSSTFVKEHPEVGIKAVEESSSSSLLSIQSHIPSNLWQNNRELQVAWLRRGCSVLSSFEAAVRTDRELALLVAEHCFRDFFKVGIELRSDRDFMIAAVSLDGRVLKFAPTGLLKDWELLVRAVANHRDALDPVLVRTSHAELKKYCKQCLDAHDMFVGDFLRGIAVGGPACALTKLNRGFETGTAFKRNVAECLGIPFASLLKAHRKCYENLTAPPPPPQPASRASDIGLVDVMARPHARAQPRRARHFFAALPIFAARRGDEDAPFRLAAEDGVINDVDDRMMINLLGVDDDDDGDGEDGGVDFNVAFPALLGRRRRADILQLADGPPAARARPEAINNNGAD